MCHIADNGLSAFVHRDPLDPDRLLRLGAAFIARAHLAKNVRGSRVKERSWPCQLSQLLGMAAIFGGLPMIDGRILRRRASP